MSNKDKCAVASKCGGCQFQGVSYQEQLKKKQRQEEALLGRFCKVSPVIGMENPYYYRNKVHAVFGRDKKGNIVSGTYQANTHRIVPVEHCLIEDKKCQEIIASIRKMLKSFKIKTYDEDTGYGLLRHVLVRRGFKSGEIMVILVLGSPILPSKNNFVKALRKEHPEITTIVLNVNDKRTSMVLGDWEKPIYGPGFIKEQLCGCTFRISPKSFFQVNLVQTEVLYQTAIEYAGLTGKETVIDAYCGTGTIGLAASKHAAKVIGIELNKDAVRDAKINAKENKITNAEFRLGDAGEFMSAMAVANQKADVVFMDPPRAGSDERFLSSAVKLAPKRIVYVSCEPETLARDLKYLVKNGYEVKKIQPVDMFPFTENIETVVLLSKLKSTKTIEVDLELSELDLTKAESKATYAEIKQYVLEKFDLKVSQLYIAQVKREFGLIERINYNVGEGKNHVPQVTPEKRDAIIDALKYYQMI